MKKLLLLVVISVFAGSTAIANNSVRSNSSGIENKCTDLTRKMANTLRLNEAEYIKLKTLNRERLAKIEEINKAYSEDANTRAAKLQEVEESYRASVRNFLTPLQQQAFAKYKPVLMSSAINAATAE